MCFTWFMKIQSGTTFFSRFPLKLVLTIPFLAQVIGVVGIIGYLSFKNGQATAQNLSSQLRRELTDRIEQQIQETLRRPHIINQINADALARQEIDVITGKGESKFWRQSKVFPSTNHIYCATEEDGAFLGVGAAIDGESDGLQVLMANTDTGRYLHYYDMDETGGRSRLHSTGDAMYDPRNRPWYIDAKQTQAATWSEIYLDFDTFLPTMTASSPVYDAATAQLMGVCATDMILSKELNDFLGDLEISASGLAFVMEPSNLLIASSIPEPLTVGKGENLTRLAATDSQHEVIRHVTQYLIHHYTDLDRVKSAQLNYSIDRRGYFLQVRRLQDALGLDWIVVVVVPEHDVMAQIYRNTVMTIVLSVVAFLLTVCLGLFITHQVSQPLLQLSAMAKKIARGDWEQGVVINSSDAIGDLSQSFTLMADQLQESFMTLEKRIEERTSELQQANQALEKMAHTDGLTQTANRRYFDDYLKDVWLRLAQDESPLTLILCDVDYFKSYNDTYGHQEGDRCLQQIAKILLAVVRHPADLVARYGGEEFAIVLSNTAGDAAIAIAKRIRSTLQQSCQAPQSSFKRKVTLSMGITTLYPASDRSIVELIKVTDRCLYEAKAMGRDRYVFHDM